jgi:preprotein translocase subunit YajC
MLNSRSEKNQSQEEKMAPMLLFIIVMILTFFVFGIDLHQKRRQILTKR